MFADGVVQVEVQRRLDRVQEQNQEARVRVRVLKVVFRVVIIFVTIITILKRLIKIREVDEFDEFGEDSLVGGECVWQAGIDACTCLSLQM